MPLKSQIFVQMESNWEEEKRRTEMFVVAHRSSVMLFLAHDSFVSLPLLKHPVYFLTFYYSFPIFFPDQSDIKFFFAPLSDILLHFSSVFILDHQ